MATNMSVPEATDAQAPDAEEERQRQVEKNRPLIELLRSWREVDEEEAREQRETWEFLKQALDEDRLSYRKLFP